MDEAIKDDSIEKSSPEIICPFIRAALNESHLELDSAQRISTKQLRLLLRNLSMPVVTSWLSVAVAIFLANRIVDIPGNLWRRTFSPLEMHRGSIKHSCTTTVLTESGNGVFNKTRSEKMIRSSEDGVRMTTSDFLHYNKELQQEPGSTAVGACLNRLEFSLLLTFLGEVDGEGKRSITISNLREMYQLAKLPKNKPPRVRGVVIRREPGKEHPLPGLNVELWQERRFRRTLVSTSQTKGETGAFCLVFPKEDFDLTLRFIDPRPSIGRDRAFYEIGLGKVNGESDLGSIKVPHWLYDQDVPFPVAQVNDFTNKVPQRFSRTMAFWFNFSAILLALIKWVVQKFFSSLNLSRLHALFTSDDNQRKLQDQDSDAYFMYRVLNGFHPSAIYLNNQADSKFPDAMYFLDCNFDGSESDGRHNLISGQLFFDINDYDSKPTPHGIYLRIRAASESLPGSKTETDEIILCADNVEWRVAKQAFRSAWATAGEIDAHLGTGHLNVGQYAIAAYRNFFSSPLRQLLLPTLRGVTEINELGSDSIFGESGVLSTCSALSGEAIQARLGSHLGTLDWYDWKPPKPLYATHTYPLAANLYWSAVNELVDEYFEENGTLINKHADEFFGFSIDLVRHCLPYFEANQFQIAEPTHANLHDKLRSVGLKSAQKKYQQYEGLGNFRTTRQPQEDASHALSVHKIENLDDAKQCCKYIIFHATFWHWWTNDLQATDLSNVFYASLGLRNGARDLNTESLPTAGEAVEQLAFARLLTSVRVGYVMDESQEVMVRLSELLEDRRQDFKDLENSFELASTFDINNIRSRVNI